MYLNLLNEVVRQVHALVAKHRVRDVDAVHEVVVLEPGGSGDVDPVADKGRRCLLQEHRDLAEVAAEW
jgi:hypothetical protein